MTEVSNTIHESGQQSGIGLLLQQNPGLGVTLIYLAISLIGLMFSWSLFSEFNVNIFNFTEVSDFLLAALREPMTFVMAGSALLVTWLIDWLAMHETRYWNIKSPKSKFAKTYVKSQKLSRHPIARVFIFVLYSYLFISIYGDWKANEIKAGKGQVIRVQLTEPVPDNGGENQAGNEVVIQGILLGSTNKYLFLYDPESGITSAMPEENIVRVLIDGKNTLADVDDQTRSTLPAESNEPQGRDQ